MQVPLRLTFRGMEGSPNLREEIESHVSKLERFCDHIISCSVVIEKDQKYQERGSPYRVRITMNIPPGHEIVVRKEPAQGNLHDPLTLTLNDAFEAAERQLKELTEKQHGEVKSHPQRKINAYVSKVFKDKGYGFLRNERGEEVYFHKNSVLHNNFKRLSKGCGVHYIEEIGEKGPQASTVRLIDKPSYGI
ncbi:MAG: HPF/RaiA family ribosome-associated protein [Candidatus Omnitrophica bacterium]|nr:HPF/RaiA family ribosome-associated protein [Candidatus Omnitrophota bacterium]MBD3268854.1 HPF/RaiA family ribosome-associated protein [Candidatus Omnitrophota bacterium]